MQHQHESTKSNHSTLIHKTLGALLLCVPLFFAPTIQATTMMAPDERVQIEPEYAPSVDLVLALDISGSMSGLINSAKQRLWDVVNELGQAQPTPKLRVAIITFGYPAYGAQTGYVRINQALTSDLDAINKTLFSFQTGGGDEYVARAIHTALTDLDWSHAPNTSKVLFVAGNESAAQDPQFSLDTVAAQAQEQGLVVNAIYCGNAQAGDASSWASIAQLGGGMYAAINQQAGAVAVVSTPMDKEIALLNQKLNGTYVAYGARGKTASANQQAQDQNTLGMSESALVSRTVTKASKLYRNQSWDLVDALESGAELEDMAIEDLPKPMQALSLTEQREYLAGKSQERAELKKEITRLGAARQDYIRTQAPAADSDGLDAALKAGLQKAVEANGLKLGSSAN